MFYIFFKVLVICFKYLGVLHSDWFQYEFSFNFIHQNLFRFGNLDKDFWFSCLLKLIFSSTFLQLSYYDIIYFV